MFSVLLKLVICAAFVADYAASRTAKSYREMPEAALRLSQAEYQSYNIPEPNGPGTYAFGYEIEDPATGNVQFRDEEKLANGTIRGSYGYVSPDNIVHMTRYIADQFGYRATTETRQKQNNGPPRLDVQVTSPSTPRPAVTAPLYPVRGQQQQNGFINPSTTPAPEIPFETVRPTLDPVVGASIYQQHQINLHPNYNGLRDDNNLHPQVVQNILNHQFQPVQNPSNNFYGFRQNVDGSVSTYTTQPNRPFFNWFNNNNNQLQSDSNNQQQGLFGFITGIPNAIQSAFTNNPITNFITGQQQQQTESQQNPFQSFLSNIFSNNNNNRPQISLPIQADYVSTVSPPQNAIIASNFDTSVFSNDHFLNPAQPSYMNPGFSNQNQFIQSSNYGNPNFGNGGFTQISSSNFNPGLLSSPQQQLGNYNQNLNNPYVTQYANHQQLPYNVQPYSYPQIYHRPSQLQLHQQHQQQQYPIYQYPQSMQTIAPISVTANPNYINKPIRKKTSSKKNKKDKNKVDLHDTGSDWFQGFLDKRKSATLDGTKNRRPAKESDEDEEGYLEDYFR